MEKPRPYKNVLLGELLKNLDALKLTTVIHTFEDTKEMWAVEDEIKYRNKNRKKKINA